jgi:hypothetical protein
MENNFLRDVLGRAVSGSTRRGRFFAHIAVVLVSFSVLRHNNWQTILFKLAMLAIGYLVVYMFELYKGWRFAMDKPWLDRWQLWKLLLAVGTLLSVIYVGAAVCLAVFAKRPDGLTVLFPLYLLILLSFALTLYWEFRDLADTDGQDDLL